MPDFQPYKTILNWSGGKDSAITLQRLLENDQFSVDRLLVSINQSNRRVSMHGVRRELIERQSEQLGIPVTFLNLPENPSMELYNTIMQTKMEELQDEGFTHSAFGDIFLEDLREYREKQLRKIGMKCLFPLWGENTVHLAKCFLVDGFKAILACIQTNRLDKSFAGRDFAELFLNQLPGNVDPCGENGEFHTFVYDGPIFTHPVHFEKGEIVDRSYPSPGGTVQSDSDEMIFRFCDLLPV